MMICPRCGTEHNQPDHICPRCFYGRPRKKIKVPTWLPWSLAGLFAVAVTVSVILLVVFLPRQEAINDDSWIDGNWQGDDLALLLDADQNTFQLISGETVLYGTFAVDTEQYHIRLTDEEGNNYLYLYEMKDPNTMKVSFAQGLNTVHATLERMKDAE